MADAHHLFQAVAFVENFSMKDVASGLVGAKVTPHEIHLPLSPEGDVFLYPFGAVVFHDVPKERREAELARLSRVVPGLTPQVVREEFQVREAAGERIRLADGLLTVDQLTRERAGIVALTVAQSAAMEYYERLVEDLFTRTKRLVDRLEREGTVTLRTRPLHRFIGEAVGTRTEVLSVLHLLDKPDAAWDDAAMGRIYDDLRAEFDLVDRYGSLESKLRGIQEALELVLDVARDRRLVLLEAAIVVLIVLELVLGLLRAVR